MNVRPLLSLLFVASTALAASACGKDGDEVSYEAIAPGAECVAGGVRITINGDAHVTCNGDPNSTSTTEHIARGEAGNPCSGDALRVTVQTQGQSPAVAWVCGEATDRDIADADPDFLRLYQLEEFFFLESIDNELICDPDETHGAYLALMTQMHSQHMRCVAQVVGDVTISPLMTEYVECQIAKQEAERACDNISVREDGTPIDFCAGENNWDESDDCYDSLPHVSCWGDLSPEEEDTLDVEFDALGFFFWVAHSSCPTFYGY